MLTHQEFRQIQEEALITDVTLARVVKGLQLERQTRKRIADAAVKLGIALPPGFFVEPLPL